MEPLTGSASPSKRGHTLGVRTPIGAASQPFGYFLALAISASMLASAPHCLGPRLGKHAIGRERTLGGEEGVDVDGAVEQGVLGPP